MTDRTMNLQELQTFFLRYLTEDVGPFWLFTTGHFLAMS
ncbi:MAG: hypothetical protein MAG451_02968 [Anaerolineales bacterium]|nr:hypothetical protein [Anaerolineales bacterium]